MIDRQSVFEIHRLRNEGQSVRKISRMLKLNRDTVVKNLNNPQIQPAHRTKASSKLDPFKEGIARLLELDSQVSAVVIRTELPEPRRLKFLIGVSLGDVIEAEGRIYGYGVNFAARIESL